MKPCSLLITIALASSVLLAPLLDAQQVSASKEENRDIGFQRVEIHFDTEDRQMTALRTETQRTEVNDRLTRSESVVQVPRANGAFIEVERTLTVTERLGDGGTRIATEVVETDRQGVARLRQQITEETKKTPNGETTRRIEKRRNNSGQLVADREVHVSETRRDDGSITRQREERTFDVNRRPVLARQVDEMIVSKSPDTTVSRVTIRSLGHMGGGLRETAREQTTTVTQDNRTETERVIHTPRGSSWAITGRVTTTEIAGSNGSIQRETIKYELPEHAGAGRVQPRLKIVEQYTPARGGKSTVERTVYVLDVNKRWVPKTFSSKIPGRGGYQRRE